jgi:hypothetical protein
LSHLLKLVIPLLNHTTPPFQSINWSKMPMNAWSLIMKPFTISASEPWNSLPQLMEIWTIWFQLPCQELLAASDSQVNWTVTWENWPSTWSHSQDCTSSWLDSLHWPPEVLNNTELWPSPNWPNKCSMLKTWCAQLIQDTEDT